MGYVEFILKTKQNTQTEIHSATVSRLLDLPGFRRRDGMQSDLRTQAKNEYNRTLETLRAATKAWKAAHGQVRKEKKAYVAVLKAKMESQLTMIGQYTPEEQMNGFREDRDGF